MAAAARAPRGTAIGGTRAVGIRQRDRTDCNNSGSIVENGSFIDIFFVVADVGNRSQITAALVLPLRTESCGASAARAICIRCRLWLVLILILISAILILECIVIVFRIVVVRAAAGRAVRAAH